MDVWCGGARRGTLRESSTWPTDELDRPKSDGVSYVVRRVLPGNASGRCGILAAINLLDQPKSDGVLYVVWRVLRGKASGGAAY